MARHKKALPPTALAEEISVDDDATQIDEKPRLRLPLPPTSGASEASFFQMAGSTCVAFGIMLALGSAVAEPIARIAGALNGVGLGGGMLVLAGMILFALGRLRRSHLDLATRADERSSNDQLLEQMAVDVVRLHDALDSVQAKSDGTQRDLQEVVSKIELIGQQVDSNNQEESSARDAIFRLAASLDQLGARVDQRMQTQYDAFRARLREVGDDIVGAHTEVRRLLTNLPSKGSSSESTETTSEPQTHETETPEAPAFEPQAYEPAIEPNYEIEETPSVPAPTAQPGPFEANPFATPEVASEHPEPPPALGGSLGVLDTIEDNAVVQPDAPLPNVAPSLFEPEPPAPLPPSTPGHPVDHGQWGDDQHLMREKSPVERANEIDAQTKLHQLNDLLADQSLREMLENIRRGK